MVSALNQFEFALTSGDEKYRKYVATINDHEVNIERHDDWLTTAYWKLPDGYGFDDFLRVTEEVFVAAEEDGYSFDELPTLIVCSNEYDDYQDLSFGRPLTPEDFEAFGISSHNITFLRLGDDLAHLTFSRLHNEVGVVFYQQPRQTKSAFQFMANMLPLDPRVGPKEIGDFVLALPS
jgi:hypothetical protein